MICRVSFIKYLGILVDSKLMWKPHITELSKKSARTAVIFFKMRHCYYQNYYTIHYLILLFFYVISIWGLNHPTNLKAPSKLQKKLLGLVH